MPQRAQLKLNLDKIRKAELEGAVQGLKRAAERLLEVSRQQVPHEEGTLERSGVATVDEGQLLAAVSYDGPYAVKQHEDLTLRHDEGRKAKYLEDPLNTEKSATAEIIAAQIRRSLR